jgi:hypothetical protein
MLGELWCVNIFLVSAAFGLGLGSVTFFAFLTEI